MLKILESNQTQKPCSPFLGLKTLSTLANHDNFRRNILDILDAVTVHQGCTTIYIDTYRHTHTEYYATLTVQRYCALYMHSNEIHNVVALIVY